MSDQEKYVPHPGEPAPTAGNEQHEASAYGDEEMQIVHKQLERNRSSITRLLSLAGQDRRRGRPPALQFLCCPISSRFPVGCLRSFADALVPCHLK